jgi:hypothetical protein
LRQREEKIAAAEMPYVAPRPIEIGPKTRSLSAPHARTRRTHNFVVIRREL